MVTDDWHVGSSKDTTCEKKPPRQLSNEWIRGKSGKKNWRTIRKMSNVNPEACG